MEKYIIQIDDEEGGKGRKIYITSWGVSVWKEFAKRFNHKNAKKELKKYLSENPSDAARIITIPPLRQLPKADGRTGHHLETPQFQFVHEGILKKSLGRGLIND